MGLVFFLTFNVFGAWGQSLMEIGVDALTQVVDKGLTAWNINPVLHSLVIDGVFRVLVLLLVSYLLSLFYSSSYHY